MTKKQKLKYWLNASNRHEAILGEIRDDIDTIDSSITILHAKIEALEQKSLSEPKTNKVYVVTSGIYDDMEIEAVFSNHSEAMKLANQLYFGSIDIFVLDEIPREHK